MRGLSVIVPVKPPEPYIDNLTSQIHLALDGVPHEIHIQYEKGLTNAVIHGIEKSQFDHIAVMDADGSHDPFSLHMMYCLLDSDSSLDLMVGSKFIEGGKDSSPFTRRLISKFYRSFTKTLLNLKVSDPMSGFVCGKRLLFTQLRPSDDYKFLLQLLCHNPPPNVKEIPIFFHKRQGGESKTSLKTGLITLHSILKLWWKRI